MNRKEAFWALKRSFNFEDKKVIAACEAIERTVKDQKVKQRQLTERFNEFTSRFYETCADSLKKVRKNDKECEFLDILQVESGKFMPKEEALILKWWKNQGSLQDIAELVVVMATFADVFDIKV